MSQNEVSSASDFEQHFKNTRAEMVTLPSGLKVRAFRPSPEWWLRKRGNLPSSLAGRVSSDGATPVPTSEELLEYSNWMVDMISEVVLSPKIRLNPGPGEVNPNWITDDDLTFLIQYAMGEVSADGRDLSTFRGGADSPPPSADSRPVEVSTE